MIFGPLPVDESVRCVTRWKRLKPGLGHPHRCIREQGHDGRHWCSCGADTAQDAATPIDWGAAPEDVDPNEDGIGYA